MPFPTKNALLLCLFAYRLVGAQTPPCIPLGQNLIANPDFEQGYFGFTSDFGRGLNNATRCNCATQGWVLVAQIYPHVSPSCQIYPPELSAQYGGPNTETNANPNHPSNTSVATLAICNEPVPDHTSGSGFFLTIDPDACEGRAYWRQPLQVCSNTNYYFSGWVRAFAVNPAPIFHFEVDGVLVTPVTTFPDGFWVQTSILWNSGNVDGTVWLELINDLPGCIENDVAVDDLFFGVCGAVVLNSGTLFRYCPGEPMASFTLSGLAIGFAQPQYQWQYQAADGGAWTNLLGQTDTLLIITAPTLSDAGRYRLLAAEQGNIGSFTCSVVSPITRLEPYPTFDIVDTVNICVGQSYAGHSESGLYTQHFQTTLGCDSIRTLDLRVRGDVNIYVPTAFSPNDDGDNDRIQPYFSDQNLDVFLWQVFDRWGNMVFETRNPAASWDGTFRGKPCEPGVYIYTLKMEIRGCQQSMLKGDVTLVR
ncbi:MAG: gliding motility-associated C-terminal domain-containing protein [Saprospiraceae bacterium]